MWVACGWLPSGLAGICRIFSPRPHEYPYVPPRASLRYGLNSSQASNVGRIGTSPRLTLRGLAAWRQISIGHQSSEIAKALGLGEETVRSHLKKAQTKLGVHNRTHAACDALRQSLIP